MTDTAKSPRQKRRRCAACDHRYRPRTKATSSRCPKCKSEDVFDFETQADLAEWDAAANEHANNRHRAEMIDLCYPE